jgi:hypothetical protein
MIKPRRGSRKLDKRVTVAYYRNEQAVLDDSPDSVEPYDEDFWEGTIQDATPIFYHSVGRHKMIDPFDNKREKEFLALDAGKNEKFNSLVAACKLRYPMDYIDERKAGKIIETADIYDLNDPFFNHEELSLVLEEGGGGFDDEKPINKIILSCLLAQDEYELGGSGSINRPMSASVRYIIVDKDYDKKLKQEFRALRKELHDKFNEVSKDESRLYKVCLALNITNVHDELDQLDLEEKLFDYIEEREQIVEGTSYTRPEYFLHILEEGDIVLDRTYLFHEGLKNGIIKRKDSAYTAFGRILSKTVDGSINFLTQPSNEEIADRIAQGINAVNETSILKKEGAKADKNLLDDFEKETEEEVESKTKTETKKRTRKSTKKTASK